MTNKKVTIEDCKDLMSRSNTYRRVLEHRKNCLKWGQDFCLDCFGGGLTQFTKDLEMERQQKKGQ